jgi:hypothetical protein
MYYRIQHGIQINKCADLASLSIDMATNEISSPGILIVNLRFNEAEVPALFGTLRYQLIKAAVHFNFHDCQSGDINPALDSQIELSTDIDHEFESSRNFSSSRNTEHGNSIDFSRPESSKLSNSAMDKHGLEHTEIKSHKIGIKGSHANVVVSGISNALRFSFETPHPELTLRGMVLPKDWCNVELTPKYSKVTASLNVAPDDIKILRAGGIWPSELSPDKNLIVRLIALKYLKIKDHLCFSEMHIIPFERLLDLLEKSIENEDKSSFIDNESGV